MPEHLQRDPAGRPDPGIGSTRDARGAPPKLTAHRLRTVADNMMHLSEHLASTATQMKNILAIVDLAGGQGLSDSGLQAISNHGSREFSQAGEGVPLKDLAKYLLLRRLGTSQI